MYTSKDYAFWVIITNSSGNLYSNLRFVDISSYACKCNTRFKPGIFLSYITKKRTTHAYSAIIWTLLCVVFNVLLLHNHGFEWHEHKPIWVGDWKSHVNTKSLNKDWLLDSHSKLEPLQGKCGETRLYMQAKCGGMCVVCQLASPSLWWIGPHKASNGYHLSHLFCLLLCGW